MLSVPHFKFSSVISTMMIRSLFLLSCFFGGIASLGDVAFPMPDWELLPEQCDPGRGKGRIEWILLQRQADYGWGYHTHHANIALAVHEYVGPVEEMEKMGAQLEFEVTKALFRNASSLIHANDLALYIHALLATNRDPRNFHGYDLVEDLLHRVDNKDRVHPFLVLALCNSRAVTPLHLDKITHLTDPDHSELLVDFRQLEYKALTLKALACAKKDGLNKFSSHMKSAIDCLIRRQNKTTGSFGNVFTTSLAVQALTAAGDVVQFFVDRRDIKDWNRDKALQYLEKEAYINVNMVKAYYIEMGLHASRFNFIRDIHNIIPEPRKTVVDNRINVKYTVRNSLKDYYFTANLLVPPQTNFFRVMLKAADLSQNFRFSWNDERRPMIYAVDSTPNDAEENMFWRICRQTKTATGHEISQDFNESPLTLFPTSQEHVILHYSNDVCNVVF